MDPVQRIFAALNTGLKLDFEKENNPLKEMSVDEPPFLGDIPPISAFGHVRFDGQEYRVTVAKLT